MGGGKFVFNQPLTPGGKIPMIALDDMGFYAQWMFKHPDRVANFNLKVATAHIDFHDIATAFDKLNASKGLVATVEPVSIEAFLASMGVPKDAPLTSIFLSTHPAAKGLTFWENFTGFWNLWNANVVERDYGLLDEIHPGRIRSVEEWMGKTGYAGEREKVFGNELLESNSVSKVARYAWGRMMGNWRS
ncbi:hypothetical protein HDU96_007572 [Phlyctochytrium bullatum]|nr:hypothetical protein HDU96_007572 [Phlyctochytrium bullatum]